MIPPWPLYSFPEGPAQGDNDRAGVGAAFDSAPCLIDKQGLLPRKQAVP